MTNNEHLVKILANIGLKNKETSIYLTFLKKGTLSALQLGRELECSRSSVYRALEKLMHIGLVSEQVGYKTKSFAAAPLDRVKVLLEEKKAKLSNQNKELQTIISSGQFNPASHDTENKVFYYFGLEGVKQILWNTTKVKPKSKVLGFGYLSWYETVGREFADRITAKYSEEKYQIYELNNQLEDGTVWSTNEDYISNNYHGRYISPKLLKIDSELIIFQDVVAYIHYYNNDYFGVEIHNQTIAEIQRQLFWLAWEHGEDMVPFEKFTPQNP